MEIAVVEFLFTFTNCQVMERFDTLVHEPDDNGTVDLSHQSWVNLDTDVWNLGEKLLRLNLSFNRLVRISGDISRLEYLQELDISNNQLGSLPEELGQCVRLKVIRANDNYLKNLPDAIGELKLLQELYVHNNMLEVIPGTIGELVTLRVLHLQNNRLKSLSPDLHKCISLEIIDCSNNVEIANVPQKILKNAELLLWTCHHNYCNRDIICNLETDNDRLENDQEILNDTEGELRNEIESLQLEMTKLVDDRFLFMRYIRCRNFLVQARQNANKKYILEKTRQINRKSIVDAARKVAADARETGAAYIIPEKLKTRHDSSKTCTIQ